MAEATQAAAMLTPVARSGRSNVGRRFASDLAYFATANVLYLVVTGVTTFLIPRVLSVEAFGAYRLFLLYAGYAGVLHLGYLDGALVSWATEDSDAIGRQLPATCAFVASMLVGFTAAALGVWLFAAGAWWRWLVPPLTAFAVIANLLTISQHALQAQKRFRLLSALTLLMPLLLLTGVGALAASHATSAGALLLVYLLADVVVLCTAWVALSPSTRWERPTMQSVAAASSKFLRAGSLILLVNLSANVIISADRLIISSHFPIRQFAIYSFAATFFYSAFFVMMSATKVAFPYLSTEIPRASWSKAYGVCERTVIVLWTLGIAGYFPIVWLTRALLPNYVESLSIIRILLLGSGAVALTQVLHFNFFRLLGRTGTMVTVAALTITGGFGALAFASRAGSLPRMAWTTVVMVAVWWLCGEIALTVLLRRGAREMFQTIFWVLATASTYLVCSANPSPIFAAIYLLAGVPLSALILRKNLADFHPLVRARATQVEEHAS